MHDSRIDESALEYENAPIYDAEIVTEETIADKAPQPPQKSSKRPFRMKIIALCLSCALLGGAGGVGLNALTDRGVTTVFQSGRENTAINVATVQDGKPMTASEIYATYANSTVGISVESVTTNIFGQAVKTAASGSGFVITEDGYILTNNHVIEGANSIKVSFPDGSSYDAKLVGKDADNDIAVVKINASGLKSVVVGSSDNLAVGETVVAIGNPLGELTFTLTQGVVSSLNREITMSDGTAMNMIQTDCAINSGNSGGPLFNSYGEVIGIVSAKYSGSDSMYSASVEGIGFAIPINDILGMAKDIMENGYVTGKPYMGVSVSSVIPSQGHYVSANGAYVNSVEAGSCAEKAGLKEGDVIVALGDKTITSSSELINAKNRHKAGDKVTLTVTRSGEKVSLSITFDEQKNTASTDNESSSSATKVIPFGQQR